MAGESIYLTLSEAAREQYLYRALEDVEVLGDIMYAINNPRSFQTGRPRVDHTKACPVCGNVFNARRTQTCSSGCANRLRQMTKREQAKAATGASGE